MFYFQIILSIASYILISILNTLTAVCFKHVITKSNLVKKQKFKVWVIDDK